MQSSLKCIRWSRSLTPQTLSPSRDQRSLTVKGKSLHTSLVNHSHIQGSNQYKHFCFNDAFPSVFTLRDLTSHISPSTWLIFLQFLPRFFLPPLTFLYIYIFNSFFPSCQIDWHKGKDVTVKTIKKKQKHKGRGTVRTVTKQVPNDSFFNFFNPIKGENLHTHTRKCTHLHTSIQFHWISVLLVLLLVIFHVRNWERDKNNLDPRTLTSHLIFLSKTSDFAVHYLHLFRTRILPNTAQ